MASLAALGLNDPLDNPAILGEDVSIHEWMINRIKCDNITCSVLSNGLLYDLNAHVQSKKNQFSQYDHAKHLSRRQVAHILCFLMKRMSFEEVTRSIERGIWKRFPKEEPPTAVWKSGIEYIQKIGSGVPKTQAEDPSADTGSGAEARAAGDQVGGVRDTGGGEEGVSPQPAGHPSRASVSGGDGGEDPCADTGSGGDQVGGDRDDTGGGEEGVSLQPPAGHPSRATVPGGDAGAEREPGGDPVGRQDADLEIYGGFFLLKSARSTTWIIFRSRSGFRCRSRLWSGWCCRPWWRRGRFSILCIFFVLDLIKLTIVRI